MTEQIFPAIDIDNLQSSDEAIPLEIAFVLDRSGSMSDKKHATISGFNEYLNDLKRQQRERSELGEINFTLTQFNTVVTTHYASVPVEQVAELTEKTYITDGNTALYDAIAQAIYTIERKVKKSAQKTKIQVTIQTDGEENSSREFDRARIFALIQQKQTEGNWTFTYLGCDIDAYAEGKAIGVPVGNIAAYTAQDSVQAISDLGGRSKMLRTSKALSSRDLYRYDPSDSGKIN
ncbi:MAG: vWA domain-containing protein [Acidobacteriota bacterium]